ncbi:hypothetical protein [Streptomyces sp. 2-1]|uniref:hypothetical protein n=1 Tax=Streptomyces sp. 2-1 TaxID=412710 RepID=UPI003AFB4508
MALALKVIQNHFSAVADKGGPLRGCGSAIGRFCHRHCALPFELWKAAISAGGPDNITLAVVRVSDD